MRFVVALLLVTAFAGCLDSNDPEPTPETPVPTTPGSAAPGVWVHGIGGEILDRSAWPHDLPVFDQINITQRISGEPTVGISRTGTVFYASIEFDGPAGLPTTIYFASDDGGQTWSDRSPVMGGVSTHPVSGDPYVYSDPTTGRIYAMDMDPGIACNTVSWSDDDGATWVTRPGACALPVSDHPTIFAGPATPLTNTAVYPNHLYLCTNQVAQAKCAHSPDGGLTWLVTPLIYEGVRAGTENPADVSICSGFTSHGHVSWATGTIYVPRAWCEEPWVAVSNDAGLTYQRQKIHGDVEYLAQPGVHDTYVAADRSGNAYYYWHCDGGHKACLSISTDNGQTWSRPVDVTPPGVTTLRFAAIAAGEDGRIAMLSVASNATHGWDTFNGDHPEMAQNVTWHAVVTMSLNALDPNPVFASARIGDPSDPIKRGNCAGRCFGNEGGMYDFLDLEMDPMDGTIWVALVDVCGEHAHPNDSQALVCAHSMANSEAWQKAAGAVGKQTGGPKLLDEPWFAR